MADVQDLSADDLDKTLDGFATGLAYASRSPLLRDPSSEGLRYEDLTYPSSDGTPLEAWFIPCEGSTRLIIAMHAFGFNRAGFPAAFEPWKSAFGPGNDTDIDFVKDYKILHDNGYNVLAFDFRNFGLSASANGNLASNNRFETRDVFGTLDFIASHPQMSQMTVGIFARCMGANVVFRAIASKPEAFEGVTCLVAPLLLSPLAFLKAVMSSAGLIDHIDEVDHRFNLITSDHLDGGTVSQWAPSVTMPTLTYGVHDDVITIPSDLEDAYAALGAQKKEMFWIRDTAKRWDGYTWFQRHPDRVLEWFAEHLV